MLITTGKVRHGGIEVDSKSLPEGATVTVLAAEGDETVELGPTQEALPLTEIEEAEQGEGIFGQDVRLLL